MTFFTLCFCLACRDNERYWESWLRGRSLVSGFIELSLLLSSLFCRFCKNQLPKISSNFPFEANFKVCAIVDVNWSNFGTTSMAKMKSKFYQLNIWFQGWWMDLWNSPASQIIKENMIFLIILFFERFQKCNLKNPRGIFLRFISH